jgi:hypothetical protein
MVPVVDGKLARLFWHLAKQAHETQARPAALQAQA